MMAEGSLTQEQQPLLDLAAIQRTLSDGADTATVASKNGRWTDLHGRSQKALSSKERSPQAAEALGGEISAADAVRVSGGEFPLLGIDSRDPHSRHSDDSSPLESLDYE